ncbi:MerR family transcriptional regulator [Spongisporangium articulatum]|uniref:MerR family transcriptional regulator n=1 Tax=Spongisporangium articulatum TaxID=3362603 RepID=A0ABW8AQF9_9ACTN
MSTADGSEEVVDIPAPPAPAPNLTVAAVARRLGVAPPTLRTWDRRYGLGPSEHTAGAHRRYSPGDVARLMVMRRLTLQGVAPADAAKIALAASVPGAAAPAAADGVQQVAGPDGSNPPLAEGPITPRSGLSEAEQELQLADADDPFAEADLWSARRADESDPDDGLGVAEPWREEGGEIETAWLGVLRRGGRRASGGGRVVAMPDGTPRSRGLARAAMSLDTPATYRMLAEAVRADGVVVTWNDMIMPVLRALGERTNATGDGIDVEHAFSEVVLSVFRGPGAYLPNPRNHSPVLLACADRDYHSLPMHALAAALAERQIGTRLLGTGLPPTALSASVRRTGPSVVVLFARMPGADASTTEQMRRQRPAPAVLLAGPGWDPETVPAFALRANSLQEACEIVLQAALT